MRIRPALPAALLISTGAIAHACPVCDSEQGQQVRSGIFNGDFAASAFQTLATFPVVLGLVVALYAAVPNPPAGADGEDDAA